MSLKYAKGTKVTPFCVGPISLTDLPQAAQKREAGKMKGAGYWLWEGIENKANCHRAAFLGET